MGFNFGDSSIDSGMGDTRFKVDTIPRIIQELIKEFDQISFYHLLWEGNLISDALATLAALIKVEPGIDIEPIRIRILSEPAYCAVTKEFDGKPWFYEINTYLQKREYLEGASSNDQKMIRRLSMGFFLDGEVLYTRNHDMTLLYCVEAQKAKQIMKEVHEGVCGTHAGGHLLTWKILRSGYYWMTMERDCIEYARKCHKC
ncbi:uncharacterized protein LOC131143826 [Malania oleifera]|uniref:uncharacterized protein LOC131143826 n=1 Tax=Malania oleifera TaxID=397392 RepID=UPI0025AE53D8|nr:uncharacterized protein LOC131143826 [Malania oleifera]